MSCECARWTAHGVDTDYVTGCADGPTDGSFIRGHDAKLKGLFITAGKNGYELSRDSDVNGRMSWNDAAKQFGFGFLVEDSVNKAAKRAEEKAAEEKPPGAADILLAEAEADDSEPMVRTPVADEDSDF